jgi:protein disulfide-isomerase A6
MYGIVTDIVSRPRLGTAGRCLPHCKLGGHEGETLLPTSQNKVIIAKTDADGVGRELGTRFGVAGFPSESIASQSHHPLTCQAIKWFPAGSTVPVDYQGGRDLEALAAL